MVLVGLILSEVTLIITFFEALVEQILFMAELATILLVGHQNGAVITIQIALDARHRVEEPEMIQMTSYMVRRVMIS